MSQGIHPQGIKSQNPQTELPQSQAHYAHSATGVQSSHVYVAAETSFFTYSRCTHSVYVCVRDVWKVVWVILHMAHVLGETRNICSGI